MSKDEIIEKLTDLGAKFSKRDSRDKLADMLEALESNPVKEPIVGDFIAAGEDGKKYLKNSKTGFVFVSTPALLRADDLIPATEAEYKAFKGHK